jgi:GT2 family glycosyltransferase
VVDNGSQPKYPDLPYVHRIETMSSYVAAINYGVRCAGKADWYLILNNDILFDAPILPIIEKLDNSFIYGRQIIEGNGYRWLGLWLALIPFKVWQAVGEFDEKFEMCGFDDADYCIRAKQMGIDTLHVPLKVTHFWGKTRWGLPHYQQARARNVDYFEKKHGWKPDKYKVIYD